MNTTDYCAICNAPKAVYASSREAEAFELRYAAWVRGMMIRNPGPRRYNLHLHAEALERARTIRANRKAKP